MRLYITIYLLGGLLLVEESGKRVVDEVVLGGEDVSFVALIVERLVVVDVAFTEGVVLAVT